MGVVWVLIVLLASGGTAGIASPAVFIEYNDCRNLDDFPKIFSEFSGPRPAYCESGCRRCRPARRGPAGLLAAAGHYRAGDHPKVRRQRERVQDCARELCLPA